MAAIDTSTVRDIARTEAAGAVQQFADEHFMWLLKKNGVWGLMGGALGVLIAAGLVGYGGAVTGIQSSVAKQAEKEIIEARDKITEIRNKLMNEKSLVIDGEITATAFKLNSGHGTLGPGASLILGDPNNVHAVVQSDGTNGAEFFTRDNGLSNPDHRIQVHLEYQRDDVNNKGSSRARVKAITLDRLVGESLDIAKIINAAKK